MDIQSNLESRDRDIHRWLYVMRWRTFGTAKAHVRFSKEREIQNRYFGGCSDELPKGCKQLPETPICFRELTKKEPES